MKTLFATRGLPASGKTTWAKEKVLSRPGAYKRINKDDLRALIDGGKWSRSNEDFIIQSRDCLVVLALTAGKHVIVDDTNLAPKHIDRLRQIARENDAQFEIVDFTNVPIEECIARDRKRSNYVGEKVIRDMYAQFLAPPVPRLDNNPTLPYCVIVDIDGTVALMNGRGPFDWHSVGSDLPNEAVCHLVRGLHDKVIFVSGRDASCRDLTERWLCDQNLIAGCDLFMRPEGDQRDDRIIKREIYDREIAGKYNVRYVVDDRNKVVQMWRALGLTCLQVAPGDF